MSTKKNEPKDEDFSYKEFMDLLNSVTTKDKEAKENEKSMEDENGGKIMYPLIMRFGKKRK